MNIHVKLSFLMNNYTQCTTLHVHWEAYKCTIPNRNAPKRLHANLSKSEQKYGWGGGEEGNTHPFTDLTFLHVFFFVYSHKK